MKKRIVFLLFLGMLFSCSEDVQLNNDPTIQGLKDNVEWEAYSSTAEIASTSITLVGLGDKQSVKLKMKLPTGYISQTDDLTYVSYALGKGTVNQAIFTDVFNGIEILYKTGSGIGDGEILITNYDGATISGSFRFNAVNSVSTSEAAENVNFNKGVFYNVPITAK